MQIFLPENWSVRLFSLFASPLLSPFPSLPPFHSPVRPRSSLPSLVPQSLPLPSPHHPHLYPPCRFLSHDSSWWLQPHSRNGRERIIMLLKANSGVLLWTYLLEIEHTHGSSILPISLYRQYRTYNLEIHKHVLSIDRLIMVSQRHTYTLETRQYEYSYSPS